MRAVVLLALIGAALAVPRDMTRIVGGEDTTIERYPYMSNMQFHLFGILWMQFCGGTLLTTRTIVSAAHCYEGDLPHQWRVYLGSSRADGTGGALHAVSQIVLHQSYSGSTLEADLAIIRLTQPATLNDRVNVASIAGNNYNLPDGTAVHAIGWGALETNGPSPQQLQHVQVYLINQELCAERYAYLKTLPGFQNWPDILPGMLCAGILDVGGRDACQGDSGGPLAHNNNILVGVTSWGYRCADEFYPGVNARVSHYSDWIVQQASV